MFTSERKVSGLRVCTSLTMWNTSASLYQSIQSIMFDTAQYSPVFIVPSLKRNIHVYRYHIVFVNCWFLLDSKQYRHDIDLPSKDGLLDMINPL